MKHTRHVGTPGAYVCAQARLRRLRAAVAAGAVLAAAAVVLLGVTSQPPWRQLCLLVGLLGGGFSVTMTQRYWAEGQRWSAGARTEKNVAQAAAAARPAWCVHGAVLGAGGDVDLIVLGPWFVAVEAKSGRGPVKVSGTVLSVGRRKIPGDPVGQALRQSSSLASTYGVAVDTVVCISEMTGGPVQVRGALVCSAKDLPSVLSRCRRVLSPEQAEQVAQHLATTQI